ncbi:hypothetical protein Dsin_000454 [Dipteronia sinensis]|uniref:FAD-binding domain-containing protein n=1 Tax=Dipteronia sinensis TaxID=43782 RepID=A0AAE0B2V5_9ROSI|nr:hypothetical protein Dsin_000454 [Dipteronia sinensis]
MNEDGPRTSVHRKALLEALADELPKDTIRFSSKIVSIEAQMQQGSSVAVICLSDGTVIKAKILIGCDGVHSVVARWLGLAAPVNSGRWAVRGMAVFPQAHGLNQEIRILVHVGVKAGFIPLSDKDVYWFCTCEFPLDGDKMAGNQQLMQKQVIENYVKDFPPLMVDIVRHTDLSTLTWAPLMFRLPWDIMFGNLSKGNVTLAGDAMHPMTPDLAQGGCAALEDAVVLGRHIGKMLARDGGKLVPRNIPRALDGYVKERRWRVALLVAASYISHWVQKGSQWWMKFFSGVIFYGIFIARIVKPSNYNCGKLPSVSLSYESDYSRKTD